MHPGSARFMREAVKICVEGKKVNASRSRERLLFVPEEW